MKPYTKLRQAYAKGIIITVYSVTLLYILGNMQMITDWSYTFHEMLFIPLNVSIIVLPLMTAFWLYNGIRSLKEKKPEDAKNKKTKLINGLLVTSMILIAGLFYIESNVVETMGIFVVESKSVDGNAYYIEVIDTKVRCRKSEYNLISVDEKYTMTYKWNHKLKNREKLTAIDIF